MKFLDEVIQANLKARQADGQKGQIWLNSLLLYSWEGTSNWQWFWIANSKKTRAMIPPAHGSAARFAGGRRAKKTSGSASAATNGTRSILEVFVQHVFISGLRLNASRAAVGHRIPIGMRNRDNDSSRADQS